MAQRRGTFMQGILAGMQAYQQSTARNRQAASQRQQIENQRLQGRMLQRQYADYQTPETPGQQRDAAFELWKKQQAYTQSPKDKRRIAWEEWKRRKDYVTDEGGSGEKMIDVKRANEIVSEMIMDFGDTTGMRDVWPTMVPSHIRDTATELVKSGRIGAAKGYLYSNYVFATPEAKKKITPLLKALEIDVNYDELVTSITARQAGIMPASEQGQERLVAIGTALREHPRVVEMFSEIGSMGYQGMPFDDISPYIEEASGLLYPGGKEPSNAIGGWIGKLGSSLLSSTKKSWDILTDSDGATPATSAGEDMWESLKAGVSQAKNWAKEQGRTLFDQEPEAPVVEEIPVEAPAETPQVSMAAEPNVVRQGTPRYDELMQKIQAKDPIEEALKRNIQVRGR